MEKLKCNKCGKKFDSNGTSGMCSDCRRKSHTQFYFYVALVILLLGFISGIALGDTYKITKLTYESSISAKFNEYETSFNSDLMLYCWIGTLLFDLFVFAINSICYRLDLIIDRLKDNNNI